MINDLTESYRILDLEPGASAEDIKRSYRELVKVWHPDRFRGDAKLCAKAEEKLKQINIAFERLCNAVGSSTATKPSFPYPQRPQQSRPSPSHSPPPDSYREQSPGATVLEPGARCFSRLLRNPWVIIGIVVLSCIAIGVMIQPKKIDRERSGQGYKSQGEKSGKQPNEKLERLLAAANNGNIESQFELGALYSDYESDVHDSTEAAVWYRKAADQGYARAQYTLGTKYDSGVGVPKDKTIAAGWYRKAAESGDAEAQYHLGLIYRHDNRPFPKDYTKAVEWHRKAAGQGHIEAQFSLALAYSLGDIVPLDKAESRRWYEEAAKAGHLEAQVELGQIYSNGIDVREDYAKSLYWFQKAAAQGSEDGQVYLGMAYEFGKGVPKDHAKAAEWYKKAAAQGRGVGESQLLRLRLTIPDFPKVNAISSRNSSTAPPTRGTQKVEEETLRHLTTDNRLTSGSLLIDELGKQSGKGKLTLDNGLAEDAFVKLVHNGTLVAAFYVRNGEKFTYSTIPDGIYSVLYCTGYGWDASDRNFVRGRRASRYDAPLAYTTRQESGSGSVTTFTDVKTLTLHKVFAGNAKASEMSLDDFDKY